MRPKLSPYISGAKTESSGPDFQLFLLECDPDPKKSSKFNRNNF